MRAGGRVLMIFGLLLAVIAGVATFLILRQSPVGEAAIGEDAVETVRVVVATQNIEPWQPILADALLVRDYPAPAPQNAVLEEQQVTDEVTGATEVISGTRFIEGQISNTRIYPGQVIVTTQLIDKAEAEQFTAEGSNASYIVPDGRVATTIPVDSVSTIAGALQAGDRVDIIASIGVPDPANPDGQPNIVAQFLLQRIEIVQIGPWNATEEEAAAASAGLVTVIMDPQQALELKAMRDLNFRFEFVLRSITDESEFVTEPVDLQYLIEQYNLQP